MFRSFLRNQTVRRATLAVVLFLSASWVCDTLYGPALFPRLVNGVAISIGIAVVIIYSSVLWKALKAEQPDRVQLLSLGIGCSWVGFLATRIWFSLTLSKQPANSPFNSNWLTFFLALFIVGGIQHIAASGKLSSSLPTVRSRLLVIALVIAAIAFGFVMGAQS